MTGRGGGPPGISIGADPGTDARAPLARANPVAKLAVAGAVSIALLLTVDVVTAGVALLLELLALPWAGLPARSLLRRGWILPAVALPSGLVTVLIGKDGGPVLLAAGPLTVTEGSLLIGSAIALRIAAIALPGIVLLATTDPADLAGALAQVLRLPHRYVLSALAATRLVGVLTEEWRTLTLARRARGLGGDGALGALRGAAGQLFALLVLAIRRATVLATAMEARGFGVRVQGGAAGRAGRTWARPSRFAASDWLVVAGGIALAGAATAAGVAAGTWNLLLT